MAKTQTMNREPPSRNHESRNSESMQEVFTQTSNLCIAYTALIQIVTMMFLPRYSGLCIIIVTFFCVMLCEHIIVVQQHILRFNRTTPANLLRHTHLVMKLLMIVWVTSVVTTFAMRSMPVYRIVTRLEAMTKRRVYLDNRFAYDYSDSI